MTKDSLYTPETRRISKHLPLNDEQSVRHNGGTPTDVTFKNGVAIFNGSSSAITYGMLPNIFSNSITVCAKINTSKDYISDDGAIVAEDDGTNRNWSLKVGVTDNQADFVVWIGGDAKVASSAGVTVNDGEDHLIIGTFDPATGTKIYVDGILGGSNADTGSLDRDKTSLFIGSRNAANQWFDGTIDGILIHNYAINDNEALNINEKRRFRALELREEKLGAVQNVSDCVNNGVQPYNSFTGVSPIGFTAVSDGATYKQCGTADEIDFTASDLWSVNFNMVLNSGTAPFVRCVLNVGGGIISNKILARNGLNSMLFYITNTYTGAVEFSNEADAANFTISNLTVQKVNVAGTSEILNVSAQSGSIIDRQKNALTLTSMSVFKDGDIRAMLFDGVDSIVDCGDILGVDGALTVCAWIKPYGWGETNVGRIFHNGKLMFFVDNTLSTERLSIVCDGITTRHSADNVIELNKWQFVLGTRTAAGVTNLYINGVLSGAADQTGNAPAAGTVNLFIGNNNTGIRTFDGLIGEETRILKGLLTAQEVSQLFSNERIKYQV